MLQCPMQYFIYVKVDFKEKNLDCHIAKFLFLVLARNSAKLAIIIEIISNKREWNNCFIKNAPKI